MKQRGFSLIELVITITVLTILTLGVLPLVKVSVRRQKEQQLRETLRQIRTAIDEFHRDTIGMACTGVALTPQQQAQIQQNVMIDPRSKVVISDCTIFGVDNPDRYPPDLETLVNGVSVTPLAGAGPGGAGGIPGLDNERTATSNTLTSTKKKIYLREIPIDPMTGERDWVLRSVYDSKDTGSWGGENVFDVHSKSEDTALDGKTKYSEW